MNNKAQFHVLEAITAVTIIILAIYFVSQYSQGPTTPYSAPANQLKVLGDEILRTLDLTAGRSGGSLLYDYVIGSPCLEFNGTTSYLDCGGVSEEFLGTSGNFTIELWVNMKGSSADSFACLISTQNIYWEVLLESGGSGSLTFVTYHSPGIGVITRYESGLSTHEWYHVVCRYFTEPASISDDGELTVKKYIHINGIQVKRDTIIGNGINPFTDPRNLTIGCNLDGNRFNGSIDDVRIYNTALTVEEINNNYEGKITTRGLVGEWRFDETNVIYLRSHKYNGTTAYNSVSDSNHGNLNVSLGPIWKSGSLKYFPGYVAKGLLATTRYNIWLYDPSDSKSTLLYPEEADTSIGEVVKSNRIIVINGRPYDVILEMWNL